MSEPDRPNQAGQPDIQRQMQAQIALRQAAAAISSSLELETVLARIAEEMGQALDVGGAIICGYEPDTGDAALLAEYADLQTCPWGQVDPPEPEPGWDQGGFLGKLQAGQHAIAHLDDPDLPELERARLRLYGAQTILHIPLRAKDELVGYASLFEGRRREFASAEIALAHDLAQHAAIALQNAQLYEQAQREIAERRRAEQALRERNQELDAFAHTVAHDLKNPLTFIIGMSEVLASDWASLPADKMEQYLRNIAARGRKMNDIIDALLLLARVREAEVQIGALDMAAITGEALQHLSPLAVDLGAEITLPASWPAAIGYAPWVEEVWANYLSNALQYGGRPPRVELGGERQPDGQARFWIQDHGPGLAPEQQRDLFVPFTQLARGRRGGHGLGLSIVGRIVTRLGGQVGVESEGIAGQGCRFWFTLPGVPH